MRPNTHRRTRASFWSGPAGHTLEFMIWVAIAMMLLLLHARSAF